MLYFPHYGLAHHTYLSDLRNSTPTSAQTAAGIGWLIFVFISFDSPLLPLSGWLDDLIIVARVYPCEVFTPLTRGAKNRAQRA
jgi:hypothetical protein